MKRYRVYIDTSVVGGVGDDVFAADTADLIALFTHGDLIALLSPVLFDEVDAAPAYVQEALLALSVRGEILEDTLAVVRLQQAYLDAAILGVNSASDALHVAYATISRADVLASWNFRHLVNSDRIRRFNYINHDRGYDQIVILSPPDIIRMMEEDDEEES